MDFLQSLNPDERMLSFELLDAFNSSDDLAEVFSRAQALLLQLLHAESVALCVSKPGRATDYIWLVAQMPPAFLAHYPELADGDVVRNALVRVPNTVLRDTEMVARPVLERSVVYQHCREVGRPMEHVMGVMLKVDPSWHGGLMLYRNRPFSEWEQALLQWLTPRLTNMVRRCRKAGEVALREQLLEEARRHQGTELLCVVPPARVEWCTDGAAALLETWFPSSGRGHWGLPTVLVERLAQLETMDECARPLWNIWTRRGDNQTLRVTFIELKPRPDGQRPWELALQQVPRAIPLPAEWRQMLTPAEAEVASCVLRGWENETIAEHRHCSVSTIKTQLYRIYNKLAVDNRFALIQKAFWW